MTFRIERLAIPDVCLIASTVHGDSRGTVSEVYRRDVLLDAGIDATIVQENYSYSSRRGVLRGLHFQRSPFGQGKLVRCLRGTVLDVAVDIRRDSPTFGQVVTAELSAHDGLQIWVPQGFAHGFCALEDGAEVLYRLSEYYRPEAEGGIAFDDPELAIGWPFPLAEMLLSERDRALPRLRDAML